MAGSGPSQAESQSQPNKSRFILRHVKFRNFVKFEDEQELKFERNGVYFLLGQNQSGKTSVLEAIRRCLSLRYSSSFSSRPKPDNESIIVTRYENGNNQALLAFCMYTRKCKDSKNDVCLKGCALLDNDNTTVSLKLDLVRFQSGNLISRQISVDRAEADFLCAREINLDAFQGWLSQQCDKAACIQPDNKQGIKNLNSECEQLLKQYLDDVVFAFPMRSFGPLQWSKSKKVEKQEDNYQEASKRAEIILWYLKRHDESKGDRGCDEVKVDRTTEKQKEACYFDFITDNRGGEFVLVSEDDIKVKKDGSELFPILKQSEGFVEAKLCSILLSVEDFATVSIEDPGTGMHPQMIDRLCLIMTEKVDDRVVIVPTHNANFLKPWLLDRMFYFKHTDNGLFQIASGKSLSENKDLKAAIPGSVTSEQFANFCYAETIVFVEGISDQLFMEALARLILRSDDNYYPLLSGIQFVNMGGGGNAQHFRKCCKLLNKKYAFLIDNDLKDKTLKKLEENILKELKEASGKDPKTLGHKFERENESVLRDTFKTEEEKFFFWKGKNLEIVFLNMLELLQGVEFNENIKAVIEACCGKYVSIDAVNKDKTVKAGETDRFKIIKVTTASKHDKLFIHGTETIEQRVELVNYLLQQAPSFESTSGCKLDLTRIHEFLQNLCNG